jgi:hypothetical protein
MFQTTQGENGRQESTVAQQQSVNSIDFKATDDDLTESTQNETLFALPVTPKGLVCFLSKH